MSVSDRHDVCAHCRGSNHACVICTSDPHKVPFLGCEKQPTEASFRLSEASPPRRSVLRPPSSTDFSDSLLSGRSRRGATASPQGTSIPQDGHVSHGGQGVSPQVGVSPNVVYEQQTEVTQSGSAHIGTSGHDCPHSSVGEERDFLAGKSDTQDLDCESRSHKPIVQAGGNLFMVSSCSNVMSNSSVMSSSRCTQAPPPKLVFQNTSMGQCTVLSSAALPIKVHSAAQGAAHTQTFRAVRVVGLT